MRKLSKYQWISKDLDFWLKKQAEELRAKGFRADTDDVSRLLYHKVIIPNDIHLREVIKDSIKIKVRGKKCKKRLLY